MFDAQVLTDGSLIVLEAGGVIYRYRQRRRPAHTRPFLCETPGSIRVFGVESRAEPPGLKLMVWLDDTETLDGARRAATRRSSRLAAAEEQFAGAPGPPSNHACADIAADAWDLGRTTFDRAFHRHGRSAAARSSRWVALAEATAEIVGGPAQGVAAFLGRACGKPRPCARWDSPRPITRLALSCIVVCRRSRQQRRLASERRMRRRPESSLALYLGRRRRAVSRGRCPMQLVGVFVQGPRHGHGEGASWPGPIPPIGSDDTGRGGTGWPSLLSMGCPAVR